MGTIGTHKGVAKAKTNIKTMATGLLKTYIGVGETYNYYVYGQLNSAETDLINFDHYYTASGSVIQLGELCKCVVQNMMVSTENEPITPPVEPPPAGKPASIDMVLTSGSVVTVKDASGNTLWTGTA